MCMCAACAPGFEWAEAVGRDNAEQRGRPDRCGFITKKGTPCPIDREPGRTRCHVHDPEGVYAKQHPAYRERLLAAGNGPVNPGDRKRTPEELEIRRRRRRIEKLQARLDREKAALDEVR